MRKNMKLATKLYLGFALPVAILVAISAFAVFEAKSVEQAARMTQDESAPFAKLAQGMKFNVVQVQQWLTDISATGAAEGLDDGYDEAEQNAQAFLNGAEQFRKMYREENDSEGLAQLADLEKRFAEYYEMGKSMAKAYIEQGREEGNKFMLKFDPFAAAMTDAIEPFVAQQLDELDESMQTIVAGSQELKTGVFLAAGAAVVLSILMAWLTTRSITKPINQIIAGLNEGADQVNDAASQVSSASQQSAEGASEQASSLEETSSALEQMAAMTRTNAQNAKQANELSTQARDAAQAGDKTMYQLNDAMSAINSSSGQIGKIIKVIEEIAFQTNLLALNAAVEAARAGEHGKGFAVVADEVRNLAQRAAQAARETTGLIEDSTNKAKEGTNVAGEVGKALGAIVGDVTKVTDLVDGITKASEEQAQGVDQVNTAVFQMDKVTQQNAAGAEESASASEQLSAQAQALKGMVGQLTRIVSGGQGGNSTGLDSVHPRAGGRQTRQKAPHPNVGRPDREHQPAVAAASGHASVSEDAMPFDDDTLKDF